MRNDHAYAVSSAKFATESSPFHTGFTQNDGQWLLAIRPYTKQLKQQY
jgi:hypothetical protein